MVWSARCAASVLDTPLTGADVRSPLDTGCAPGGVREPTTLSCLALQDVCSQGLQFGQSAGGQQDELREPDG